MTMEPGKDFVKVLLTRSDEALLASRVLLEKGLLSDSISRAYYSMYYASQALLLSKNIKAKSHSGTITLFGKEIVAKGLIPKALGKRLNEAYDLRQKGDYDPNADFEYEDIEKFVDQASDFVNLLKTAIK
jgi:uncharacterized protein (UPF0332 family)